jgi:hypothetical protein
MHLSYFSVFFFCSVSSVTLWLILLLSYPLGIPASRMSLSVAL